ncbi:MAG: DinB family protein [Candidatus Latescibacterota bacterium]|nr:MAG: DinB family protein [Candidatus Latescibacterota bacterium]
MIHRPGPDEYAPYFERYIKRVPDGDILDILAGQIERVYEFLGGIDEESAAHRYGPDKWSIKQVVGHIVDCERVFSYRALRFARDDKTPLPGFDQDEFVTRGHFDQRSLDDISNELRAVRLATLALFRSFEPEILLRRGTASGFEFTVRSIPYLVAGHELHHLDVIQDRYLSATGVRGDSIEKLD